MSEPIHAVAFDFDGTLADTHHAIQATMAQTFADFGVELAPERVTAMIGLTLHRVFAEAGLAPDAIDRAVVCYREIFPGNLARVLFPGVLECLRELSAAGVPLGIVSSRGRVSLLDLVERLELGALFREVLGDEDVVGKKPAPDFVLRLSERRWVPPARLLVVGDTTYDIEMATPQARGPARSRTAATTPCASRTPSPPLRSIRWPTSPDCYRDERITA